MNKKLLNILITGANGYIGMRLIPKLVENGHRVYCAVRNPERLSLNPIEEGSNIRAQIKSNEEKILSINAENLRLNFIKENLFNPHEGLWAETKQNSQFREDSKKWRLPIGVGFISLVLKNIWDSITT